MNQEGFRLIIAGGLGIYLKREFIRKTGRMTLFKPLPEARATEDIDSFLTMDIFLDGHQARVREVLRALEYTAFDKGRYFQFIKPDANLASKQVKVDLHARSPTAEEVGTGLLKVQGVRLGHVGHTHFRTLHAYETPEAFAIDEGVQELPLLGHDCVGAPFSGVIHVPHPFASLCMKLRAAQDFERVPLAQRDERKRKHAFDVYLLIAMLGEAEFEEVKTYARSFDDHAAMPAIREAVATMFNDPDAPGCRTTREQLRGAPASDLPRFCAALRELFAR